MAKISKKGLKQIKQWSKRRVIEDYWPECKCELLSVSPKSKEARAINCKCSGMTPHSPDRIRIQSDEKPEVLTY